MTFKYPFLTIINDLNKAANNLILVGGWVPTVYFEYLWQSPRNIFKTGDVDLALSCFISNKPKPMGHMIEKLLQSKTYQKKHLQLGKEKPYQLIFNSNTPIDFLVDPRDVKKIRATTLGQNIILNESEEYRALLESPVKITCDGVVVKVPLPSRYVVHKIYVYLRNREKRKKDLATAYYCLTRSPNPDTLMDEIALLQSEPIMKKIEMNKPFFFGSKTSPMISDIQKSLAPFGIDEDARDIEDTFNKIFEIF